MVFITEELVRKKAEHNEGLIGTLEELSLHQEDVEKIEHLNNWCKNLQILYLQANQISKIENLNKLKQLQYLNLAINNVEKVENLERCESLEKLDLTLNFIGDLESIKSLQANIHLKDLYLTGNPCCDYEGYRDYVIAQLPQLESLDIKKITRSERIKARQNLPEIEKRIKNYQEKHRRFREEQKVRHLLKNSSKLTDEEFWQAVAENSPETRMEISKRQKKTNRNVDIDCEQKIKKTARLFDKTGRPLNVNQAKLKFTFSDDDPEMFVLDVALYKYLDTALVDIDLQPIYVKLTVKGKVFQIVFPEEVLVEKAAALRSQTTGHLVLKLPRVNYKGLLTKPIKLKESKSLDKEKQPRNANEKTTEFLEVTGPDKDMDFSKIVENNEKVRKLGFEDNPEVPMLEYG
ncbi:dynein axonemal assembly factor 11 [Anthonomus grandis grandis]|uniref:dynein axonemal assembly factor 11 n=1 Tax=Anthonomus grandis grandis TaxID=2921223 RepID=UPI0021656864|nr:dynein axonemal assembly factor 11 [Anthonomus grandis grandis]